MNNIRAFTATASPCVYHVLLGVVPNLPHKVVMERIKWKGGGNTVVSCFESPNTVGSWGTNIDINTVNKGEKMKQERWSCCLQGTRKRKQGESLVNRSSWKACRKGWQVQLGTFLVIYGHPYFDF